MTFTKENLKELANAAAMLTELKDTEEVQAIITAAEGFVDEITKRIKPRLQAFSEFRTELDINAINKMVAAGIEHPQAIALRLKSSEAMSTAFQIAAAKLP